MADEAYRQTVGACREILSFFEAYDVSTSSLESLNRLLEADDLSAFLSVAEGFGLSMAFIDHNAFHSILLRGYENLSSMLFFKIRTVSRKLSGLDPEKDMEEFVSVEIGRDDLQQERAELNLKVCQMRVAKDIPLNLGDSVNRYEEIKGK